MPGNKDMPSSVTNKVSGFDRFAVTASELVSKPWFFALCVLLILVWAPSFLLFKLLQNTQQRADHATQHKLNAIGDGLADLMRSLAKDHSQSEALKKDLMELRKAVGLEHRESS